MARAGNLSAQERRTVTVEAVIDLAGKQIPSDITTAEIAAHMKLTQGALFRHFPSKNALWEAVMTWVAERLMARFDEAVDGDAPLATDKLEAAFMSHISFVIAHPGVPRLMFGELQRPDNTIAKRIAASLIKQYGSRLEVILAEGVANGELRPDLDTHAAATLFIGTIQGLVMQSMLAGSVRAMQSAAPGVFEIYRNGLIARNPVGKRRPR